jgi:hypothetical protein
MGSEASETTESVRYEWDLLDGEDPLSSHPDDPEHWVAVYGELRESTTRMLEAARERLASHAAEGSADAKLIEREISILVSRNQFFSSRHSWWANRGRELWKA